MSKSVRKGSKVSVSTKGAALAQAFRLAFFVMPGTRPEGGDSLKGFTVAWMDLAGLHQGATMPRKAMQALAGETMVSYNLRTGRIAVQQNGEIGLTDTGREYFSIRTAKSGAIAECAKGWHAILRTGKADGALVRNPSHLVAIETLV